MKRKLSAQGGLSPSDFGSIRIQDINNITFYAALLQGGFSRENTAGTGEKE